MSVGHPDLLVCKFGSVCTQCLDTIVVSNDLSTLHHEAWNNALKDAVFEVDIEAKLTGAESAEVFNCPRQVILEKFHHYSTLCMPLLPFCSNVNIHENLNVLDVKIWHSCVNGWLSLTILTRLKYFSSIGSHSFILALCSLLNLAFESLPMTPNRLILRHQLNGVLVIGKSIHEVTQLQV